jgi:hypothetical protein
MLGRVDRQLAEDLAALPPVAAKRSAKDRFWLR